MDNAAFDRDFSLASAAVCMIEAIMRTGVLHKTGPDQTMLRPCATQVLIDLNDVLQIASKKGDRVTFDDHVEKTDRINDVTDLVAHCRNAACHITSNTHRIEQSTFNFGAVRGQMVGAVIGGHALVSQFPDDTAFFYGTTRIYLNRHIVRAFQEAQALFNRRF